MAEADLRLLLRTIADVTGIEKTSAALRRLQQDETQTFKSTQSRADATSKDLLKMAGAAGVAGVATTKLVDFLGDSVNAQREHERVTRATAAAYGGQTASFTKFAAALEAQTGFTSDAILTAALSARTLSQNYGLTTQQTQKLISVSADLARVRGIGIAEAFERVQSAIRGEAEASEYLGLTLNDTFLKNQAMNGSLKTTFETMSDGEKAQVRYNELLKQSAQFSGLAAQGNDSLDGAFNRAGASAHNLQLEVGKLIEPRVIDGLKLVADTLNLISRGGVIGAAIPESDAERNWRFLEELTRGESLAGAARNTQAAQEHQQEMVRQADLMRLQDLRDRAFRTAPYGTEGTGTVPGTPDPAFVRALTGGQYAVSDARTLARQAMLDQLQAATRDLVLAQNRQLELQRESVQLSAEEARIKLSLLPTQQRMAELQREVTEQQIRARQAALPATERLEDLRYEQQRLQLTLAARRAASSERSAIRRQLRDIGRALPGAELDALIAGRGVTLAGRTAERVGLESQLFDIAAGRALAGVTGALQANQLEEAITNGMISALQQTQQSLADRLGGPLTVNVQVTLPDGSVVNYTQLLEATQQAMLPPIVPQSGVRHGPF